MNYFVIEEIQSKKLVNLGVDDHLSRHSNVKYVGPNIDKARAVYELITSYENDYWITTRKYLTSAPYGEITEGLINQTLVAREWFVYQL